MRKTLLTLWVLLVLYTAIHIIFFFQGFTTLNALITFSADPLLLAMFNLMGLFPLAFILFVLSVSKSLRREQVALMFFSFFTGAFAVIPLLLITKKAPIKPFRFQTLLLIIGLISSLGLILLGVANGNVQPFITAFNTDSFVHIMTIDFIVLTLTSMMITAPYTKKFFYAIIPVFGFFIALLDIKKTTKPVV